MKTWFSGLIISAAMAATALVGLIGCEETLSGTDVKLPYREELIVQGFLTADGSEDTILITRTLHPLDKWSIDKAAVTDAVAMLTSDGVEYRLVHVGFGRYYAEGLKPVAGKTYKLNVSWKNLNVTASATIPATPEVIGLTFDTVKGGCDYYYSPSGPSQADEIRFVVEYVPHGTQMNSALLGFSYSDHGSHIGRQDGYEDFLYDVDSSGSTNKAILYRQCYAPSDPYNLDIDTLFLRFSEYDEGFTRYYESRWNGGDDNPFFGTSGEQPEWNVTGDGFGWFFGRSTVSEVKVLR